MRAARWILAASLLAAPLAAQPWPTWSIGDAPPNLRLTIARADVMIATMQDAVLRELAHDFAEGGPEMAFRSAHLESGEVARRLAREGVAAGRTSDRLRDPTNAPRPWAAPLVGANAGRRARDVDGFVVDLGDRLGVLRPISERPICATCHGPVDRISPALLPALAERYPSDKATGFMDGEIRGWFWLEIPKAPRR